MKEFTIRPNESGQRFDKYLHKVFDKAPMSFVYKMLRKKNFTLNDKKATGQEKLSEGDAVKLFLSDETFAKMSSMMNNLNAAASGNPFLNLEEQIDGMDKGPSVVYEDDDILIFDKPAGMLSQKAKETDWSVNEYLIGYLLDSGALTKEELHTFKPSIANRLDRNTSGLILCGKTLRALQYLSEIVRNRSLEKYYRCIVEGEIGQAFELDGYLIKDEKTNTVYVNEIGQSDIILSEINQPKTKYIKIKNNEKIHHKESYVCTGINPIGQYKFGERIYTELEIHLITGKTHQIRAHLAGIGHPLLGDAKYGHGMKEPLALQYHIKHQLLHAYKLIFPQTEGEFAYLSGKIIECQPHEDYMRVIDNLPEAANRHSINEDNHGNMEQPRSKRFCLGGAYQPHE